MLSTNYASTNYTYKEDLGLNNLQWLIYNKTQPTQPTNLHDTINLKTVLFDPQMWCKRNYQTWSRVEMGVMPMKTYFTPPISHELEPHHQM